MKEYTALVSANILETEPAEEREEKSGVTYGTIQKVSYYSTTCKRTRCFNKLIKVCVCVRLSVTPLLREKQRI